jgi:cysteine sulfinate desulfinase/cysteine desulfurase-like protein
MNTAPIDFDTNATTPLDPRGLESMLPYFAVH